MSKDTVRIDLPRSVAGEILYEKMKSKDLRTFVVEVLANGYRLDNVMEAAYNGVPKQVYNNGLVVTIDDKSYEIESFNRGDVYTPYTLRNIEDKTDYITRSAELIEQAVKSHG